MNFRIRIAKCKKRWVVNAIDEHGDKCYELTVDNFKISCESESLHVESHSSESTGQFYILVKDADYEWITPNKLINIKKA